MPTANLRRGNLSEERAVRTSIGRVTQLQSGLRFGRRGLRLGTDRFEFGALDRRRFDTRGHLDRAGLLHRAPRTRMGHRAGHQHLRPALVMEIAVSEAHAGHRSAEADLVPSVEIETRLERNAPERGANRLSTDLQRIAGQAHITDRTGAAELYRTGSPHVVEDPARAAGAVETCEREDLAGYETLGLFGIHLAGHGGHDRRTGHQCSQYKTRKHARTPTLPSCG